MTEDYALIEPDLSNENFTVVRLSESNKAKLYREALDILKIRDSESEPIITRLSQLNVDLSRQFGRKDSNFSKAPLRLVFPTNSPIVQMLKHDSSLPVEINSYLVISYCWRCPDWSPVRCDYFPPWPFGEDIVQSILDLRIDESEGIFIDRLCINQKDEEEKRHAVANMNVLYSSARRMVIIMEDVQLSQQEESVIEKYITPILQQNTDALPSSSEEHVLATAYLKIFNARWSSRAWCAHEFKLCHRVEEIREKNLTSIRVYNSAREIFKMPFIFLPWFWKGVVAIVESVPLLPTNDLAQQRDCARRFADYATIASGSPSGKSRYHTSEIPIIHQFSHISQYKCRDLRDKISIALNVCELGIYYKGNPQTEDECWWVCTALSLALGEIQVLALGGQPLQLHVDGRLVTSWARRHYQGYAKKLLFSRPETSISRIDPTWIELDLLIFSQPIKWPSQQNIDEAWDILLSASQLCGTETNAQFPLRNMLKRQMRDVIDGEIKDIQEEPLSDLYSHGDLGFRPLSSFQPPERYAQCVIAHCLERGLIWMRVLLHHLEDALAASETWNTSMIQGTNPDLEGLAHALLEALKSRQPYTKTTGLVNIDEFQVVHRILTISTHWSFRGLVPWPSLTQTGSAPEHQAFTPPRRFPQKQVLAMPVALSDIGCTSIGRAWVLERVDFSGNWQVSTTSLRPM